MHPSVACLNHGFNIHSFISIVSIDQAGVAGVDAGRTASSALDRLKRAEWDFAEIVTRRSAERRLAEVSTEGDSWATDSDRPMSWGLAESGVASPLMDRPYQDLALNSLMARLLETAPAKIADGELLELLIYLVSPSGAATSLAGRLLQRFGSFGAVMAAREPELVAIEGMERAVIQLVATVRTTLSRLLQEPLRERALIGSFTALLDYLQVTMANEPVEQARILFLDRKNFLIRDEIVARGTVDHTPLYPREVLKLCLDHGASAIILVHNHPSGDPEPSSADIAMTQQIDRALQTLDIALHDHVVVGRCLLYTSLTRRR